jgi:CBS-domain-containing membrane protein
VGDLAVPPEPLVQAGWSGSALTALLCEPPPREATFPVVGVDREPVAVVTLRELARVPAARRDTMRVRDAGKPVPGYRIVAVDTPPDRVVGLGPVAGTDLLALVVDHGRLTGVVTTTGVARLVQLTGTGR